MTETPFPQADRDAVVAFFDCMFRYAGDETFINLRAFHDGKNNASRLFVESVKVNAENVIDRICARIYDAASQAEAYVFCPPVCVFTEPNGAAAENLAEGLVLTVECDHNPGAAREKLTSILGKPTAVVTSGGLWKNPDTGRLEHKLHLHWRLTEPTRTAEDHERLREARVLAAELVGGPSGLPRPTGHPYGLRNVLAPH
jgi:hypothetical protein